MLQPCLHPERSEAGCDEAGRGCLAGPVYAAAVLLPKDFHAEGLNDSKQLSEKQRSRLRETIEREAIAWALGIVSSDEIDKINILNASILAMQRAVLSLRVRPEFLLIDGNRFRYAHQLPLYKLGLSAEEKVALNGLSGMPYSCEVKGDGRFLNIAAASVLAKTYRDDCMLELHAQHPEYRWDSNKGYPTKEHRDAIRTYGITKHHRTSFKLLEDQLSLEF